MRFSSSESDARSSISYTRIVVQPAGDLSAIRIRLFPYVRFVMIEETIMAEDESLIDRSFCSFDKSFKICELKLNYILFPSCLKLTETSFFKVSKS